MKSLIKQSVQICQVVAVCVLMAGCNDFLSTLPDNRAEIDTEEEITKLLVSAYPEDTYCLLTEMASDNTDEVAGLNWSFDQMQKEAFDWADISRQSQDSPYALWSACYSAIATANKVISSIEERGWQTKLSGQLGEALMCRAYAHFVLVNVFCQHWTATYGKTDLGIPYMESNETTVSPKYERGTVDEVYQKIDADIERALPLMKDNLHAVPKYHFTVRSAWAFAARFNLYYCRYDKVVKYASLVLTDDPASTLRDWESAGALNPTNNIRGNAYIDANNRANLLIVGAYSIWGRVHGPLVGFDRYTHNDVVAYYETCKAPAPWGSAGNLYYSVPSYSNTTKVIMVKIEEYFEFSDVVSGIGSPHIFVPVFTTDETLLCRAEAYAMLGEYDKATADMGTFMAAFTRMSTLTRESINRWGSGWIWEVERPHLYYTPYEPTPIKELHPDFSIASKEQENFIQTVLYMRRVLTLHEGLRWFDLKRYGMEIFRRRVNIDTRTTEKVSDMLSTRDKRYAIQLPAAVISAGMEPNPRD